MWNVIEHLASDDTGSGWLSIGSRQESGSALYQINALLKVSSSEKVLSNPKLCAFNSSNGCVLVADRTILVLDNICQSLHLLAQNETEVDVVGLCQEGRFLMVGERSGKLNLMHVSSQQTLLSMTLAQRCSSDKTYLNLILENDIDDQGSYHAFILTNNGVIYIMHLPLAKAQEAIDTMDLNTAKKLLGQVETCFISTEQYHTDGCLTSVTKYMTNKITLIIGGVGDCSLSVWEVNPDKKLVSIQTVVNSHMIKAIKKLQVEDNLLFALDDENVLTLWDVYTLTLFWDWPSVHVEDFLLTSESEYSSAAGQGAANLRLVALTQSVNENQMRNILIFSLPSMNQLYSLEVSNVSSLVQSRINTDTIYFWEGICEKNQKSRDSPVSFLVVRCLTEALPENRLSRLLHKRKFTEAENFAVQFGLDLELVYKVKMSSILERLTSESVGDDGQAAWLELVVQAKETLNKTKDNQFVVEYCINTPWPTYETALEMLNYAKIRVLTKDEPAVASVSDWDPASLTEVLWAQARLTTFYGAFGPEKFSGTAWLEFLNTKDVFKDIILQLEGGNLSSAQYLWLRHQADFGNNSFNVDMLENLLKAIPSTACLQQLCLWLKETVIPFVRKVIPPGQKRIAKWLNQRARNLELTDKANWPENGLELAQTYFTSKTPSELGLASAWCWVPLREKDCAEVCSLMKLVRALQGLVDLFRKYNCRLALSDFEKENASTIVFRMFDKVLAAELIPATLERFIEPYMCQHNLQKDEILLQYIKDLLERYCTRSTSVFGTAWEAKASAVLGCMSDMDLILEGVLAIMHSAVVPWSPGVEQLVKRHLEIDRAEVKLLREGYRLMEMKKLLWSYRIRDTNLLNDKQMMLMLVMYILKQDTPSCLEDALKIVNAYMLPTAEVYLQRIVNLIDKEKGVEGIALLKTLPPAEAAVIGERTLLWGRLALENEMGDSEERTMQLHVKKTLVELIKFLLSIEKDNLLKKEEYEADLKLFKALANLQENFGICLSARDYENPSLRSQLLNEHIKICGRKPPEEENGSANEGRTKRRLSQFKLARLASLLQGGELELESELMLRALHAGKVEEALKICRESYEHHHNEKAGQLLISACQKLSHMFGAGNLMATPEGLNLPAVIHKMACQAATICSCDLLLDAAELCKCTSFACEIYGKCQIDDSGFIAKTSCMGAERDPYVEWTFDDFFTEDGAVLDHPSVLPLAYEITSSIVPLAERQLYPLDSATLAHCPFKQGANLCLLPMPPTSALLRSLQESSQLELALGLIVTSFGSLFQHMVSNNMDFDLGEKLHHQKTREEAKAFLSAITQKSTSMIPSIGIALLHKVFKSRMVDHSLALGYCTVLPKEIVYEKLWDVINNSGQNYTKVLAVGLVGAEFARLDGEMKKKQAFEELISDAQWGIQLGKRGISFQDVFRMPAVRKKDLLRTLVQNQNVDSNLLLQFCSTFVLDSDSALQLCIETLLLQNTSTSHIEADPSVDTRRQPQSSIVTRVTEIIPLLKSTTGLVMSLSTLLHKLDPYDYETIESLLVVKERASGTAASIPSNQALKLIKHLKSYKRTSAPGKVEHQYAFEHALTLSPAAQSRLPFHLIFFGPGQHFWKIISAELNEDSFPKLLLICKLMMVSLDTLHMSAANRVFQEKLKPNVLVPTKSGDLLPIATNDFTKTLRTIQSYLLSIVNLEWSTALAHKITQELPTGPLKVQALKFCLCLAEKWLKDATMQDESQEKVQDHVKQLQVQYQRIATEAVLVAHKLNLEQHRKLLRKPAHLIVLLYQHSSIAERIQNPTGRDYPDIHAATEEIAKINNVDLKKIWDMLLEKWLFPNVPPAEKPLEAFKNLQEDEDFKRVLYLLQLYPTDSRLRILYECATSTTSPIGVNQLTFAHRSRALKCLIYLADPCAVESLFKKSIDKVKCFLKCLIYLAEFETLNIPYTYQSFHSAPKEGMIKGLWKNHSHEPRAVKLVTELSLEYRVHDPQLWSGLLQKLISFDMIHYLREVLTDLAEIYSLWQIPNFSRAWRSVALAPFLSASCPPAPDQLAACCESFKILLMCPVLSDLDVIGIAKQYSQLDLVALALGCLLLIPQPEKRAQQIQGFLTSCQPEAVLEQAAEHLRSGEVAAFAAQIRGLILDYILNEGYEQFAITKNFPLLKLQEISTDKVKGLVKNLVDKKRMDVAATLITELRKSGKPVPPDMSSSDIVKLYLSELE